MTWKSGIVSLLSLMFILGAAQAATAVCDKARVAEAKREFQRLRDLRRESPDEVSEGEFRAASISYVGAVEDCYRASGGESQVGGQMIDEGGLWFNNLPGAGVRSAVRNDSPPVRMHNLTGTKWGSGSDFLGCCDNFDAHGPQLPGGTVTYSFMANGVNLAGDCGMGCTNTAISSLPTFQSCFMTEIADAFSAWSAVADIQFLPINDGGGAFNAGTIGDIRIGAHTFDGASGTLAHAFFPPPNGTGAAGDLHLDSAENWSCEPSQGTIDIGTVVLHELGHSLGLGHETGDPAVMQPIYNPAYSFGPLADDIVGVGEIYGGSPIGKSFFFGDVGVGTDFPAASLHVKRYDGTARVLVEEASSSTAQRILFQLNNNGGPIFALRNSNSGNSWSFSMSAGDQFQFSRFGTGGPEIIVDANGRVRMGPGAATVFDLSPSGNLAISGDLTANGVFYASDRDLKENFAPLDGKETLRRLVALPMSSWNYKSDSSGDRHIGPMAQDFQKTFNLGSDESHINVMDVTGVTVSAVQGLYELVLRQQKEIEALRARLDRLEKR